MFGQLDVASLVAVFVAILISMTIHEAMHAFTSLWLGDDTAKEEGRITLNPLMHIDFFATIMLPMLLIVAGLPPFFAAKPVPFNPSRVKWDEYGAALVGVSGPLTNLTLAIIGAGAIQILSGVVSITILNFLSLFVAVNVAFFVFNMIPFPPLDGSRLLYAFAPQAVQRVMASIESLGLMAIVIFMLIFFSFLAPLVININQSIVNFLL
jgi:Zn-dependent protease